MLALHWIAQCFGRWKTGVSCDSTGFVDSHVNNLVTDCETPDAYWVLLGLPKDEAPGGVGFELAHERACRRAVRAFFVTLVRAQCRPSFSGHMERRRIAHTRSSLRM